MFLREAAIELRALRAISAGKTEIVGSQIVFLHERRQIRPCCCIAPTSSMVFNPPAKLTLCGCGAHLPVSCRGFGVLGKYIRSGFADGTTLTNAPGTDN